jgi:hypothetical protein
VLDDLIALPGAISQNGAHPVRSECVRITSAPNNASLILREGDAGSASPWTFVVNDCPTSAVVVFAAIGENMDGVLNGSRTIAASQSAYFMRVPRSSGAAVPDWRSGVIA